MLATGIDSIHGLNVAIHVGAGLVALGLGLWQLLARKGDGAHRRRGVWAWRVAVLCVASALLGALVFRPSPDLVAVSVLVGYQLYSGRRCLPLARNGRAVADWGVAALLLLVALGLVLAPGLGRGLHWEPVRARAVAASMALIGVYDLVRIAFPAAWRRFLNPAEHAWRLCSMVGAMASVLAAQRLPGPVAAQVSLVVSGAFGLWACIAAWQAARKALGVQPSRALNARLNTDSAL